MPNKVDFILKQLRRQGLNKLVQSNEECVIQY